MRNWAELGVTETLEEVIDEQDSSMRKNILDEEESELFSELIIQYCRDRNFKE